MYLLVTVDTEEDNWGEYDRPSYTVENIRRIPRLRQVFEARGVRPTFLVSFPVAASHMAVHMLGSYRETGHCEIGTHPHPWNTPPPDEDRTVANSYISHLPSDLQYRKIGALHERIKTAFGVTPTSYRSGRWGFSETVARNLIRLGYRIDSSISPVSDWRQYGGPDYSAVCPEPFVYQIEHGPLAPGGSLLEVPATIDFVQRRRALASSMYWAVARRAPASQRILNVLGRAGVLNHVCLSPETHDAPDMIRLARALLERGARVVNMFFHSPSLLEKCAPFVRTAAEAERFVERIDRFLEFARAAGLRSVTMSELTPAMAGASRVKLLPDSSDAAAGCHDPFVAPLGPRARATW